MKKNSVYLFLVSVILNPLCSCSSLSSVFSTSEQNSTSQENDDVSSNVIEEITGEKDTTNGSNDSIDDEQGDKPISVDDLDDDSTDTSEDNPSDSEIGGEDSSEKDNPGEGGSSESGDDNPGSGSDDNPGSGEDNPGSGSDDNPGSEDDNPGSGSEDNPGSGSDDNPGSGSDDNPGSGGDNPGSGSDVNPGSEEDNPGSGSDDNPGSGEDNPGSGSDVNPGSEEDNPGSGSDDNPGSGGDNPGSGSEDNPGSGEDNPGSGGGNEPGGEEKDEGFEPEDIETYKVNFYTNFGKNNLIFSCDIVENSSLREKIRLGFNKYCPGYYEPSKSENSELYPFVGWSENPRASEDDDDVYSLDDYPAIHKKTNLYAIHSKESKGRMFVEITSPEVRYLEGVGSRYVTPSVVVYDEKEFPNITDYSLTNLKLKLNNAIVVGDDEKITYNMYFGNFFEDNSRRFVNIGPSALSNYSGCAFVEFGSIKSLSNYACQNSSFNAVEGEKITSIGEGCFKGCKELYSFSFPAITSFPKDSFNGTGLIDLSITSKVKSIGEGAFANCSGLEFISYGGTKANFLKLCSGSSNRFTGVNPNAIFNFSDCSETLTTLFG